MVVYFSPKFVENINLRFHIIETTSGAGLAVCREPRQNEQDEELTPALPVPLPPCFEVDFTVLVENVVFESTNLLLSKIEFENTSKPWKHWPGGSEARREAG